MTRLRIGHTKFSHGYLMDRSILSYCDDCFVQVTVKHIILVSKFSGAEWSILVVALSICVMGTSNMEVTFTRILTLFIFEEKYSILLSF